MNEIAQDASSVGNALKTISMRIRAMDEETGEFDDTLQTISGDIYELTHGQVSIMQDANTYKDIYTILDDISKVWDSLTDKEHATLTETLFGKHRANIGSAIISNFEQARKAIETMENADGGAMAEMEVIMDSISYKTNTFKETLVGIAQNSFSQDFMKSMVDSGTRVLNVFDDLTPSISFILEQFATLLEFVTKLADAIGGIPLLIAGISLKNVGNIKTWIADLKQVTMAVNSFKNITQSFNGVGLKAVIDDVTIAKYATSIKGLTLEQANLALSTTQLSATEKESVLVKAGLIAQTEALTATDAVYRLQQKLGNKLNAEEILTRAGLVTQKEIEDGTTIKLTADKLKEALATGNLSLENYKLIASTFGVEGANYGEAVSFEVLGVSIKKAAAALWAFLTTNPVGWAILAAGAIAATVAILDHFTVSLEESKEQLKELKTECNNIESDLSSMNNELQTTVDRMKELEDKDTLTFTEKEEYDNLKKTNKELQRKIDLLELEQEINNREKNKTFIQTMVKDTNNPFEYTVNPDGKKSYGQYSIGDEYSTNETGYIKAQFEARKNLLDELSKAETQEEKDRIQASIDEIDSFLKSKNKEWSEISQDISYIPNPTTDDDKAVNEWLDYINDFQDKMAIELGRENAKTNAFNRLVDNWQFDGLVQGLQDLGEQGQVTAEMLNDPKYDEFIQKLVELGVIDSADNLDLIALAFNNFEEKVEPTTNAVKAAISSTQELLAKYDDAFSNQSKIQSAFDKIQEGTSLTADEVRELVALYPALAGKFKELADGYSISGEELINANKEMTNGVIENITKQRDELVKILNTPMSVNSASDAKIAQDYFAEVEAQIEVLDLILTMFGINVQNTEETLEKQYEELSKSVASFTSSQKDLNSALEEQEEHGQLSASTIQSLTEAGYAEALVIDKVTGAVTLNTTAYEKLINEKKKEIKLEIARLKVDLINPYKDETAAIADLERSLSTLNATEREATLIKIANMRASLANSSLTEEQIRQKEQQLAELEAMLASLDAPTFDNSSSKSSSDDPWKDEADSKIKEIQHLEETGIISHEEYINRLDAINQKYFANNEKYLDDYNKYEEEIYKARKDREQDLFDKKIENLDKEKDKALENNDFETAKTVVNTQITETQNRIIELKASGRQDIDDEIKQLEDDLDDLDDTLNDINSQEYEFKVSLKTNEIDDLDREFEKSGDTSIYDKQIGIYEGLIGDTQDEINRLLDLGYSMESEEIQNLLDDMNGYSDKIADIWDKQTEIIKDNVDEQIKALDRNIENTGDTSFYTDKIKVYEQAQKDIYDRIEFYRKQGYAEDSQVIKDLKEQWVEYGEAITDTLQEQADAQIETYSELMDEQKEILEKQKETQDELFDSQIKSLEKQKEALEDVNEQLEKENTLNEKIKAIEDARNNVYKNRRMVYTVGGGWEIKDRQEDLDKVKEAQKDYSDELRQQEIDKIQDQIDAIENAKSAFDETIDKQIKAIEESEKSFEEAMKTSYETRKKLDREFIASIVGEDKADEYLANANVATSDTEKDKQKNNTTSTTGNNTGGTQNNREYNSSYSNPTEEKSDETKSDEIAKTLSSTDLAIQKMYEMFSNKGAFIRNVTLDQFVSDLENGVLLKPVGANDVFNPNVLDTGKSNSVYNTINNNSPVFNQYFSVDSRNKDDVALANMMGDIAEQKVITGLQAFNAGVHNASSTRRSTKR